MSNINSMDNNTTIDDSAKDGKVAGLDNPVTNVDNKEKKGNQSNEISTINNDTVGETSDNYENKNVKMQRAVKNFNPPTQHPYPMDFRNNVPHRGPPNFPPVYHMRMGVSVGMPMSSYGTNMMNPPFQPPMNHMPMNRNNIPYPPKPVIPMIPPNPSMPSMIQMDMRPPMQQIPNIPQGASLMQEPYRDYHMEPMMSNYPYYMNNKNYNMNPIPFNMNPGYIHHPPAPQGIPAYLNKPVQKEKHEGNSDYSMDSNNDRGKCLEMTNNVTYNVNSLLRNNILSSDYFKTISSLKTLKEVLDEIYAYVDHVEPYCIGNMKVPSTIFCCLYKLFTMQLSEKQVKGMIDHKDCCYIRACGFLYLRYVYPPDRLWKWFEPYLLDEEEFIVSVDKKQRMSVGEYVQSLLSSDKYFNTVLPRLPAKIKNICGARLLIINEHRARLRKNREELSRFLKGEAVKVFVNGEWQKGEIGGLVNYGKDKVFVKVRRLDGEENLVHLGYTVLEENEMRRETASRSNHRESRRSRKRIYGRNNSIEEDRNTETHRERYKERDRDKYNRKERHSSRERYTRRDRDRERDRDQDRDRDRHKYRDRDKYRDEDRDRKRRRDKYKDRERKSERYREKERGRDNSRDSYTHRSNSGSYCFNELSDEDYTNEKKRRRMNEKKDRYRSRSKKRETSEFSQRSNHVSSSHSKSHRSTQQKEKTEDELILKFRKMERERVVAKGKDYARKPESYKSALSVKVQNMSTRGRSKSPKRTENIQYIKKTVRSPETKNEEDPHLKELMKKYNKEENEESGRVVDADEPHVIYLG